MKKAIIILPLVVIAYFCFSTAIAGTNRYTTDMHDDSLKYHGELNWSDGIYSANYFNAVPEQQYILYVIENNGTYDNYTISSDSVVYIDQKSADLDGNINFIFTPITIPTCTVILAGEESPIILGTLARKTFLCDVNQDEVVDLLDITLIAQAYGGSSGVCDVNGDEIINLFVLVIVAQEIN